MVDDTRDIALTAIAEIRAHGATCIIQNQENERRWDRAFAYMKEAHTSTEKQINDVGNQINTINIALSNTQAGAKQVSDLAIQVGSIQATLAEQRGAGKLMKMVFTIMGALLAAASGFLGGKLGH